MSFAPLSEEVTNYVSVRAKDLLGNTTVWFDIFYIKKDITSPDIIDKQSGDVVWRKEQKPDGYDVDFEDYGGSLLNYAQYRAVKYLSDGTTVYITNWEEIFTGLNQKTYTDNWNVNFDSLLEGKNYIWTGVFDNANNSRFYLDAFFVNKDTTPPVCVDYQTGDDLWRTTNDGTYNIDFKDATSGSGLKQAEIYISTSPAFAENPGVPAIVDWTVIITTNNYEYTANWSLPDEVWSSIPSGPQENYVSVRSIDFAYNTSTVLTDAFYVLKDTIPTRIVDQQDGDDIWRRFGGTVYNVDFEDEESLLRGAQYIVRNGPNPTDTAWTPGWVSIFGSTGTPSYTTDWSVDFANLWEGTNYIFVRSSDTVENWTESAQPVFYVKKDVSPPAVINNQPGDYTWRSSSGTLYGVFFQDGVSGVTTAQYQIKDTAGNLLVDWTNIFGGTTPYLNYNSSWTISETAFNKLVEGTTNYVYVRCNDISGNSLTLGSPVFFILKDTTPPYCVVNQNYYESTHSDWYVDVDFYDPPTPDKLPGCSKLKNLQYTIYTSTGLTGDLRKSWTNISGFTPGTTFYVDGWKIDFVALPIGTTCYVSVKAVDFAGSTTDYIDAFRVLRTTPTAPIITVGDNSQREFIWYNSSTTFLQQYYDLDFAVGQEAYLSTMSVIVYSDILGTGEIVVSETIVISTGNVTEYTEDWQVKPATFTPNYYIWELLREGTNYVSVIAYDTENASSTLYDVFFIKKDTTSPPVPILSVPINAASTNQLTVNFIWQPSTDLASGTSSYTLQISTDINFSVINQATTTVSNVVAQFIEQETTYYWRVQAKDLAENYSEFSSGYKLWVDTTPPAVSNPIVPTDGTTTNYLTITFSWSPASDAFSGLKNYILQISTSPDFIPVIYSSTTILQSCNFTIMQSTYYWRIRTEDNAGNYQLSTINYTLLIDTTPPSVPVLSSPVDGLTTNYMTQTFTWAPADDSGFRGGSGVKEYILQISTSSDFSVINQEIITVETSSAATLSEGNYYWRVNSRDNALNYQLSTINYQLLIDTSAPGIYNYQTGDEQWRNNPGTNYNVDFEDKLSKLHTLQYTVYTTTDQQGSPVKDWTDIATNINAISYTQDFTIDFSALPESVTCYVSVRAWDNLLQYSTSYNVFYVLKDVTKPEITDNQIGDDNWRNVNNGFYNINFTDDGGSKLQKFETKVMSGALGSGTTIQNWTANNTTISGTTSYNQPWALNSTTWELLPEGKSYVSVRVYDNSYSPDLGYNMDTLVDAFYVLKDTSLPEIVNYQTGDNNWRSSNYATYNVDFNDAISGSGVQKFEVYVSTNPAFAGNPGVPTITDWTIVLTTNTYSYTKNWSLPDLVWSKLLCELTNYVSVRVFDFADNVSTTTDAFFVLKDTTPPTITNLQEGDTTWRKTNNGFYNVDFYDEGGSKLNKFQICASTVGYGISPFVFGWQDSGTNISGTTYYIENWQLTLQQWNLLNPGTNYISLRVIDNAFSTTTLTNVFYILKDTQPPSGTATGPTYSSTDTFNLTYTAVDYGPSGIKHVKLYYTLQTEAPYTWTLWTTTTAPTILFNATSEGKYGFRIVVYDNANNTDETDPPLSTTDPELTTTVDLTAPTVDDQQPGDDVWRNSYKPDGYALYFHDYGSGLDSAQYIIRSGPGSEDEIVKDWTYIFQSTNVNSYTQNWQIDFDSCKSSFNYVSVRVWDISGRTITVNNVFYVKKDTQPAIVGYNEFSGGGDNTWRNTARPDGYNVDFYDGLSWLSKTEYRVIPSSDPAFQGAPILNWQTIATGISSPTYTTNWHVNFDTLVEYTTNYVHVRLTDIAGNISTYYVFYVLKDTTSPTVPYLISPINWATTNYQNISFSWTDSTDSASGIFGYELYVSTDIGFSVFTSSMFCLTNQATTEISEGQYWWRVRAKDNAGNYSSYSSTRQFVLDTSGSEIIDNQTGDETWRTLNSGIYDVDFKDLLTSVSYFQTIVYSGQNMTGNLIDNWRTVISTDTKFYTQNWQIKNETFDNMVEGINYLTVRCFDNVGNVSISTDVFYVRKDTTSPIISSNEPVVDETWYNTGRTYDVNFYDYSSLLDKAEYTVFTGQDFSGSQLKPWTEIFTNLNSSSYETDWSIDFGSLQQGYNYVSVRNYDIAGNVSISTDVFCVKKDTVGPVAITDLTGSTGTNEGEINLSWTAPYDPSPGSGLQSYIVKFATFVITEENFDTDQNVRTFVQDWVPQSPGTLESKVVTGLSQNRNYYIGIKSQDLVGNNSLVLTAGPIQAKEDTVAPFAITTLSAQQGDYAGQIKLTWVAPGDNSNTGNLVGTYLEGDSYAGYYVIRYWENEAPAGWDDQTPAPEEIQNPFTPSSVGSQEEYTIGGLNLSSTYYFMVRTFDKAGLYSTSNSSASAPAPPGASDGVITWGSGTSNVPKYRNWSPPNWLATGNAYQVSFPQGHRFEFIKTVSCPKIRNEKLMLLKTGDGDITIETLGNIYLQRWDVSAASPDWVYIGQLNSTTNNMPDMVRNCDLAYEQESGRCLIAYYNGSSGQIQYCVWSSTASSWVIGPTNLTLTGVNGAVYWLRLEPRPNSNQIMLATLDVNSDIFCALWDGDTNQFLSISTYVPTTTASIATEECFDLAWETQNQRCMILWGQGTSTMYSLWSSTGSNWTVKNSAGPNIAATANWLRIKSDPRPNSNYIAMTSIDGSTDWNVCIWNGTTWAALPTEDAAMETNARRCTDVAWEKDSGRCIIVAGDSAAREISYLGWSETLGWHNPTTNTSAAPSNAPKTSILSLLGDINWLGLVPDPNQNKMICYIIDQAADLTTVNWTGSSWTGKAVHETTVSNNTKECASLALDKHDIIPPTITDLQDGDNTWRAANTGSYNVDFADEGGSLLWKVQTIVYSGQNKTGTLYQGYTNQLTNLTTTQYTTDWQLTSATWDALREGINYITVKVFDGAGNSTEKVDCFYIRKDTTAPTVPTLVSPIDNTATNYTTIVYDWSDSYDGTSGVNYYQLVISTDIYFTTSVTTVTSANSVYSIPRFDGVHYWRVRAKDVAGNWSFWTSTRSVIIDTSLPVINNNVSGDYTWRNSSGTLYDTNFYDEFAGLKKLQYKAHIATGAIGLPLIDWTDIALSVNATYYETNWSVSASSWVLLQNGTNYVSILAVDLAGNTSTWTDAFFIRKDVVLPQTPILISPLNETVTTQMDILFSWSEVSDIHSGVSGYEFYVSTDSEFTEVYYSSYTSQASLAATLEQGQYWWKVRSIDNAQNYSLWSTTYTLTIDTSTVATPVLLAPSSGTWTNNQFLSFDWSDVESAVSYEIKVSTDISFAVAQFTENISTSAWSPQEPFLSGIYYWKVKARNLAGNYSLFSSTWDVTVDTITPSITNNISDGLTTWYKTNPENVVNIDFYETQSGGYLTSGRIDKIQYKVHTGPQEAGSIIVSYDIGIVTGPFYNQLSFTENWMISNDNWSLLQNGTNYVTIRVLDLAGNTSTWTDAFIIRKDIILPTINNQQTGDFIWRSSSGTTYAVYFNDTGGSKLDKFQICVSTVPSSLAGEGWGEGVGDGVIIAWTDLITGINANSYNTQWSLTSEQFSQLYEGTTNYVSVKVFDLAGNTSTYFDTFFVLKDTTSPRIVNNETTDRGWLTQDPGPIWDIDFYDDPVSGREPGCSKLNNVFYRAKTSTGGVIIDWFAIATSLNTTYYTQNFSVDFEKLYDGINYIDVRVVDYAGNTTTYIDAFIVKKDTTVPEIEINFDTSTVVWINTSQTYDVDFYSQGGTNLDTIQYSVWTGPDRTGTNLIGWTNIATPPLNVESFTDNWSVNFAVLQNGGTNYVSLRGWNIAGSTVTLIDAFRIFKDVSLPSVIDNVSGDDTVWRSSNVFTYNVDFYDIPFDGSELSKFQLKITSGANQTGEIYQDWTDEILNIGSTFYTVNWPVKWETWLNMREGINYVSAKVFDGAANTYELSDIFFVLKDTTQPTIDNQQAGDDVWRRSNSGIYNVNFEDSDGSKLSHFEVTASTVIASVSEAIPLVSWTTVQSNINSDNFTDDWSLPSNVWDALQSQTTNYIFVQVFDNSVPGNSSTSINAVFYVLKDTAAPEITNNEVSARGWFKENPGPIWDIDFEEQIPKHCSKLDTAQWSAFTGPAKTGQQIVGWIPIFTNLNATYYYTNWDLGNSTFTLLIAGTNYITVRCWDVAGTTSTLVDAFIVKKDTFGPTIIDNQSGYDTWLNSDPGPVWDVDFKDELSKLATAFYIIYPDPAFAGTPLTNWTTIFLYLPERVLFEANWSLGDGTWELLPEGTSYLTLTAFDNLGNQTTYYDVFYICKDTSPPYCEDNQGNIYATSQSDLDNINIDFFDTGGAKINYVRYKIAPSAGNPPEYIIDWKNIPEIAEGLNTTYYITNWSITEAWSSLPDQTTSYVSVKIVDFAGNTTTFVDAFLVYKQAIGPTITDNQPGDNTWRNTLSGVYFNIDFQSNSGTNLDKFEILVTTTVDGTGVQYTSWSVIVSNIGAVSYTADWQIQPDSYFFNNWLQGKNYAHVRVYDLVPTESVLYNAFYVLKDTAPPIVDDLQDDTTYFVNLAGTTYNIDFRDSGIGITTAQYLISYSSTDIESTKILDWTDIFTGLPVANYTTDWQLNFTALQEWATNYVSVRCYDGLGYSTGPVVVFYVLKDTTPPTVPSLSTPSDDALLSNQLVNFSWSESTDTRSGIERYILQVSTVAVAFMPLYYSTNVSVINHTATFEDGKYWWRVSAKDKAGNYSLWSTTRSFLIDTSSPVVVDNQTGYDLWLSSNPGAIWNIDFEDLGSGLTTIQYIIYPNPAFGGTPLTTWTTIYAGMPVSSFTTNWEISSDNFELLPQGTSYVSVRCFDRVGISTTVADAFYIRKDTSAPTISGVDSGGTTDTTWRNVSKPGGYDVNFHDSHSLLKDAWYCVSTNTGITPPFVINWTPLFTNLNQPQYLTDWSPSFALLIEGVTNYVSVRVQDNLGHMATYYDVFFVLKDITKPTISNKMPSGSDSTWRNTDPGSIYDIDFQDSGGSKLNKVLTKAMRESLLSGATVYDWTDTLDLISFNTTFYFELWGLDFDKLVEGRNYISIRTSDTAGNFETLIDAFFVLKDTTPPTITKGTWDEDAWYAQPPTVDIDFNDAISGSGVKGFDIKVSTESSGTPTIVGWTLVKDTNTYSYTENWNIPQSIFDQMISGTTNYCWLRVYDFSANTTTDTTYRFIVKKDTAGVKIVDNEPDGEDSLWRSTSTERSYNVDFYSLGETPLIGVEYIAYPGPAFAGNPVFNWTAIPGFVSGTTYYETDWEIGSAEFEKLLDSATNYISVRCWNTSGSTSTKTDVFWVKKDTTGPTVPILSEPIDGFTTNQTTINFVWQLSTDLASGTSSYTLQISTDSGFSVIYYSTTTAETNTVATLSQATYYWRVQAKDFANNYTLYPTPYTLIIDTTLPSAPELISPINWATTNYIYQTFEWGIVTDSGPAGISHYRLEISTSSDFNPLNQAITTSQASLATTLSQSTTYYWRVFAVDRAGNYSTVKDTYAIVIDTVVPQIPTLTSPLDNYATNQITLTFEYTSVDIGPSGIKNYELQISSYSNFSPIYYSTITTLTQITTTFTENIYWWKVKSQDRAGNFSSFSSTRQFIVDISSPEVTTPSLPTNDTRTNSTSINFQWSSVTDIGPSGLKEYKLEISTDNGFGIINYSSITINNSANMTISQNKYFWRVLSNDNAGNYSTSTSFDITIDTTIPSVVDNQSGDDIWRAVGTTAYDVDFFDTPSVNGAGLDYAQYIVYPSTNPDGTAAGNALTTWQTIFNWTLPTRTTYYTDNFDLSPVWEQLQQGYNFVFVRCDDMATNTTNYTTFVFYIKKDTGPPTIINNEPETPPWDNEARPHDVDFRDYGIGVKASSYTAWTEPNKTGTQIIPYTTIFDSSPPVGLYSENWTLNFNLLNPGTNYISLRTTDDLGNVSEFVDVFRVLKDTIPPAGITNLSTIQGTPAGSIRLSWTAPADDNITEPANIRIKTYLVKYKTTPFTSKTDFLSTGTTYYQNWPPLSPGSDEIKTLTGFTEGTTYYIGILVIDKAQNDSPLLSGSTNYTWATRVPPAKITTLVGSSPEELNPGEVKLSWIAVGDDGNTGNAKGYVVKYATSPFAPEDWNSLWVSTYNQSWIPVSPGQTETKILSMPLPGTTYYFAIKVYDDAEPGANYSIMSNTVAVQSRPSGPADGILCYAEGTLAYPRYYKTTSAGASWTGPSNANTAASTIYWTVLRTCPVIRNEKLLGTLSSNGAIYIQRWDGVSEAWQTPELLTTIAGADAVYRPFDIAYEQNSGKAIVVYRSSVGGQVYYRVWSSTAATWLIPATALTVGGTGLIRWVRLEPRPATDEIMLVTLDANNDIYAYYWNGTTWINNVLLTASAYTSSRQCYDIAFEQTSGRCMVFFSDTGSSYDHYYRIYTPGTGWNSNATGPAITTTGINWVKLASERVSGSNRIAMTWLDIDSDWIVSVWNGSSWVDSSEISTTMDANTTRLVDIAWEKDTGECLTVGVVSAAPARYPSYSIWSSGSGWSALTQYTGYDLGNNTDLRWLQLVPDPNSNKMVLIGSNAGSAGNVALRTINWTGTGFSGGTPLSGSGANSSYEFFYLSLDRHDNISPTYADYQTGDDTWRSTNNGTYSVYFYDTGGSLLTKVQTQFATGLGGSGIYRSYKDELVGLNVDNFETPWSLTSTSWEELKRGKTYVSLKVSDGVGNFITIPDAFYIQKDTEPPKITNNITGGLTTWYNSDPGSIIDIDFSDQQDLSKLSTAYYFVNTLPSQTGVVITTGTVFSYTPGRFSYETNWSLGSGKWDLLQTGTNYITVQVFDVAGNTTTIVDAFRVLKDTIPPQGITNLSALAGPFRGSIQLQWTAPFDVGCGRIEKYLIKYSTSEIDTDEKFDTANIWQNSIVPKQTGQTESITITGLDIGTTYYFRIKSKDISVPYTTYWSVISNLAYCKPQSSNVYINEVCPSLAAGSDWIELYNNLGKDQNLAGWTISYNLGSIDLPGSESVIWTGQAGSSIPSGGFYVIDGLNLDHNSSYHIKLKNNSGVIVDIVQWPVLSSAHSFSRISDGNDKYFEIDPTPTKGYSNYVTTGVIKINEVNYTSSEQFIELYNTSSELQKMTTWYLRNSNNSVFEFTRKVSSYSFTGVCWTSVDNKGKTWDEVFGTGGLKSQSDFVVLENDLGQVVDRVSWQSGAIYSYRNYKSQLVYYEASAIGGVTVGTIGRQPQEGSDTDVDSNDWTEFSVPSLGLRNNNPAPAPANIISYPVSGSYIPRRAKIELTLGANSSGGSNDVVWFIRTGGLPDSYSPHIYLLSDLGFDLSSTSKQTTNHVWIDIKDIDGYGLVDGAIYKLILNTDIDSGATSYVISNITYDAAIHSSTFSDITTKYLNADTKNEIMRIVVKNKSNVLQNKIAISKLQIEFLKGDGLTQLTTDQAQSIFDNLYIYVDNLSYSPTGTYQISVDTTVVAWVTKSSITAPYQIIYISTDNIFAQLSAGEEKTYFLVGELTQDPTTQIDTFKVRLNDISNWTILDLPSEVEQISEEINTIITSSPTIIIPKKPPEGTNFPVLLEEITPVEITGITQRTSTNKFLASGENGKICCYDELGGTALWTFNSGSKIVGGMTTSDIATGESGSYLYFANESGSLYKLNYENGSVLSGWPKTPGTNITGMNVFNSGKSSGVWVFTSENVVKRYTFEGNTHPDWYTSETIGGIPSGCSIIDDYTAGVNNIWLGTTNGKLTRISNADGTINQEVILGSGKITDIQLNSGLAFSRGCSHYIYISDIDGTIRCRESQTLTQGPGGWNDFNCGSKIQAGMWLDQVVNIGAIGLYFGADNGILYKINPITGEVIWQYQTGGPIRCTPIVVGDYIYFGSDDGFVYALHKNDKTIKEGFPVKVGAEVRELIWDDPRLLIGTKSGEVYCVVP